MWSSAIKVHPWVGQNFEHPKHFSHKTLILGESNFTEPEKFNKRLVQECVENDMSDDSSVERDTTGFCRFSTKIRRIVFASDQRIGPDGLWHDVAFYNFVQSLVGDKARIRPKQEMWVESVSVFTEIVSTLKPARILVLGKANWNNLLVHVKHKAVDAHRSTLDIGGSNVTAGYVNHPSSSLSYGKWQPIAKVLLLD